MKNIRVSVKNKLPVQAIKLRQYNHAQRLYDETVRVFLIENENE